MPTALVLFGANANPYKEYHDGSNALIADPIRAEAERQMYVISDNMGHVHACRQELSRIAIEKKNLKYLR